MKQIINGLTYSTETATKICDLPCSHNYGDFAYHDTRLYRTAKGRFFLAGAGGPMSMWSRPIGNNGRGGGRGVIPLTDDEARDWMETCRCSAEDFAAAGLTIDEA